MVFNNRIHGRLAGWFILHGIRYQTSIIIIWGNIEAATALYTTAIGLVITVGTLLVCIVMLATLASC